MDPFIHFPAQGVIVCSECKHAVLPSHVNAHLEDEEKHKVVKEDRERIVQEIRAIKGLKTERAELNHLVFPPVSNPPIPALQAPRRDGMKCQLQGQNQTPCQYISCQVQKIQEHCRVVHGWVNPQKKGRPEVGREVEVPWRSGVHCQHFFIRGPGAQFFEVANVNSQAASQMPSGDIGFETAKQELERALKQAEEEEHRQITEPEEARCDGTYKMQG